VWTTSAGFVASLAGGALAPGGAADFVVARPGRRLGARLGLVVTDTRDLQLGTGRASWTRLTFSLGARYRIAATDWRIDLHADALAAALLLHGVGFPVSYDDTSFDPGLAVGMRASLGRSALTPWLGLQVHGLLRTQQAFVSNPMATVDVPHLELLFAAGLSLGTDR